MPIQFPDTSDKSSKNVRLKFRFERVLLVYVVFGLLLGIIYPLLRRYTSIPSAYVGPAVLGFSMPFLSCVLNWLVRSGYASWLGSA